MTEQQQEQAARYALGELSPVEEHDFIAQVRADSELRGFLYSLQRTVDRLAVGGSVASAPSTLKERVMNQLRSKAITTPPGVPTSPGLTFPGLHFLAGSDTGWKPLPVPGAFIKLLSLQRDRGYAVMLGKLERGVRYPAHTNIGPEDFYILSGDLHVGNQVLGPGDFHHAEVGSLHGETYSVDGCTLLAVLTTDDPLVQLAIG